MELTSPRASDPVEIGGYGVVQNLPAHPVILERDRLNALGGGMHQEVKRKVCPVVGSQNRVLAGIEVEGRQRRRVAVAAVRQVQRHARDVRSQRHGRQPVFQAYLHEGQPLAVAIVGIRAFEDGRSAALGRQHGQPDAEVVVGVEAERADVILNDERHFARENVHAVNVVVSGVAVVQPDERLVREVRRHCRNVSVDALERRQIVRLARLDVDGVDMPVLVALRVLYVEQVSWVVRPDVELDAALGVGSNRAGGVWIGRGRDPDVQHAVQRRQKADARPVAADPHLLALRIAEQRFSRNEGWRVVVHVPIPFRQGYDIKRI